MIEIYFRLFKVFNKIGNYFYGKYCRRLSRRKR